jgi:hypothetical protein
MIIDSHYDYWRSICKTLRHTLTNDERFIPKENLLSRDISPSWVSFTEEMIDTMADNFAKTYLDTEHYEIFVAIVLESSIFNDFDVARMNRKYGKEHTDFDATRYAIYRLVKIVMTSVYKIKQKRGV